MAVLNVNTDAVVAFSNKLEKLSRSAFPVAVRQTLNSAAFDVKKTTMPNAAKVFENRSPNFFKANSTVKMAQGFNLRSMKSEVGFTGARLKGGSNFAVKDLGQQENGGAIKGKSFIPTNEARKGNSSTPVRPMNRLSKVKGIIDARKGSGTQGSRFNKAAAKAGRGGYVLANYKSKTILWRVNSVNRTKDRKWKLTAIYSYKENRSVKVKATGFMFKATKKTANDMEKTYIENAKRQFEKVLK
jgi:hypothetical protein